jgi:hypothetical protein
LISQYAARQEQKSAHHEDLRVIDRLAVGAAGGLLDDALAAGQRVVLGRVGFLAQDVEVDVRLHVLVEVGCNGRQRDVFSRA